MRSIFLYIFQYFREVNKKAFIVVTLFIASLVFLNYHFGLEKWIVEDGGFLRRLVLHYLVYLAAFALPYHIVRISGRKSYWRDRGFLFLLFFSPLIFSFKHSFEFPFQPGGAQWQEYWRHIVYWPVLVVLTTTVLFITWRFTHYPSDSFYGLKWKGIDVRPYLLMLVLMIPLIAMASTQPDFLEMYPKMKVVTGEDPINGIGPLKKLLFELAYGTDFITIELFFRGFLVLAFIKWAGKDAILPMACFYCTIHFGKPLAECISSYFGGLLLGVVVFHTRSIMGGLIVHLGIAWLMEAGGWIGHMLKY